MNLPTKEMATFQKLKNIFLNAKRRWWPKMVKPFNNWTI
jgi:hypothetical protein